MRWKFRSTKTASRRSALQEPRPIHLRMAASLSTRSWSDLERTADSGTHRSPRAVPVAQRRARRSSPSSYPWKPSRHRLCMAARGSGSVRAPAWTPASPAGSSTATTRPTIRPSAVQRAHRHDEAHPLDQVDFVLHPPAARNLERIADYLITLAVDPSSSLSAWTSSFLPRPLRPRARGRCWWPVLHPVPALVDEVAGLVGVFLISIALLTIPRASGGGDRAASSFAAASPAWVETTERLAEAPPPAADETAYFSSARPIS